MKKPLAKARELDVVHRAIDDCRVCSHSVRGFRKPPHLDRGEPGPVMIIGQGPGNAELQGDIAFAGQSGTTLNLWLVAAGANTEEPRRGIYLTAVIKCCCTGPRDFKVMERNCWRFLQQQMAVVRPRLVITLGRQAYMSLRFTGDEYGEALCNPERSSDHLLISGFGFDFWLLPWPHPSGLNRWHNVAENRERLRKSFVFVRKALEGTL